MSYTSGNYWKENFDIAGLVSNPIPSIFPPSDIVLYGNTGM